MGIFFKNLLKNNFQLEVAIASVLFIIAIILGMIVDFIIYALYFMIFLEIVRALIGFIYENRVKLRILIDIFIILALREFIVNVVKINNENFTSIFDVFSSSTNFHVMIFSGVLVFLFGLRFLARVTSPDNCYKKNCKTNKEEEI